MTLVRLDALQTQASSGGIEQQLQSLDWLTTESIRDDHHQSQSDCVVWAAQTHTAPLSLNGGSKPSETVRKGSPVTP